jgi:hypothetical protein
VIRNLRRRRALLSFSYISGRVDDDDSERGTLHVHDRLVRHEAGKIHLSLAVKYEDFADHIPGTVYDYKSE